VPDFQVVPGHAVAGVSEHTVHRHLANIRRKPGLSSPAAAAAWGVRTGLV